MVFGVGGVGSHCIEALARTGVGKLILVDNDKVSVTNINRQSIAFHSTVGEYKTQVMKRKILDICPDTEVETHEVFVLPDNVDSILDCRPDYIVDAIDTVTAKLALAKKAMEYNIPIISSMGTGNKLHGEMFEIEDISRITHLKVLYSKEKPVKTDPDKMEEDPGTRRSLPGSISFVPPVAGLLIAGEVIRDIAGL